MRWDRIIESKIRAAQAEGKFDNLRGRGQPLKLDDDPFENPEWALANDLLKQGGFLPDWLEQGRELQTALARAREAFERCHHWRARLLAGLDGRRDLEAEQQRRFAAAEWERAQDQFRHSVAEINQGVLSLNLKVPLERFQRRRVNVDEELRKFAGS